MSTIMCATHVDNRVLPDPFFGAANACGAAIKQYGKNNVVNATLGAVYDEAEQLVCLPTVEKIYRSLSTADFAAYAPISGTAEYLATVESALFSSHRPQAYVAASATPGGSGAIRNAIFCYSEKGDAVLTHDWFWGPYRTMTDIGERTLSTFSFFNEQQTFDVADFKIKTEKLLAAQSSLLVIINSPGHNPVGYSLSDSEWDEVIEILASAQKRTGKRITLLCDVAYIDFAGDREAVRAFLSKFNSLSEKFLVLVAFSMSKSFTLYGQRCGALVAISSSSAVIEEYKIISERIARATWSNCNRGAMQILVDIYKDAQLLAQVESERHGYVDMIAQRVKIFEAEAAGCGLIYLPYRAGFFITIPTSRPQEVWQELADNRIFGVALDKGVRIAICGVPLAKTSGVASSIGAAINKVGG